MVLTEKDRLNLIDALREWEASVGPKELDEGDVGLDYDRYHALIKRLQSKSTLENGKEITIFWACDNPDEYREGMEYRNIRQAEAGALLRKQGIVEETYELTSVKLLNVKG